jgi:HSP20 family protein
MPRFPISRWDPLENFRRVSQEMLNVLEGSGYWPSSGDGLVPSADIEETDDAFVIEIELPGVKKSDINIDLGGQRLVVTAELKERERVGVLRRRTRTFGTYHYEVVLPGEVDPDRAEASLADGVLTLRLPKPGGSKARSIPIK